MSDSTREPLVADFERQLGCRLPEDYRRFLLAGPVPALGDDEEAFENPCVEILHSFHDLDAKEEFRRLSVPREGLPAWFLPVGDAFGVEIGLGIAGEQFGRVYDWPHDTDTGPRFLYNSFGEALESLKVRAEQWERQPSKGWPDA